MQPLKRVVIKEELVALTGDITKSIVLNQLIYWSERVRDVSAYKKQENARRLAMMGYEFDFDKALLTDLQYGWIYKSAQEMADEIMMSGSRVMVSRIFKEFEKNGWVISRRNPKNKMDKTKQYRVDIVQIQKDLYELGYNLEGYPLYEPANNALDVDGDNTVSFENSDENVQPSIVQNEQSNVRSEQWSVLSEQPKEQIEQLSVQNEQWNVPEDQSNVLSEQAIPEITTETTSEIITEIISDNTSSSSIPASDRVNKGDTASKTNKETEEDEFRNKIIDICIESDYVKEAWRLVRSKVDLDSKTMYGVLSAILEFKPTQDMILAQIETNANKAKTGELIDYVKYFRLGLEMRMQTYLSSKIRKSENKNESDGRAEITLRNWIDNE
jgi:hypothetical protein